jgi:hypothetical protein
MPAGFFRSMKRPPGNIRRLSKARKLLVFEMSSALICETFPSAPRWPQRRRTPRPCANEITGSAARIRCRLVRLTGRMGSGIHPPQVRSRRSCAS